MAKSDTDKPWRSRISGSGVLRVDEALIHPDQWRTHSRGQQEALAQVLDQVGWVQQVIISQRTGYLLDGVCRITLAKRRGETEVPCVFVDVSEAEERLILASLDPIGAMANADRDKLSELLEGIHSPDLGSLLEEIARANHLALDFARPGLTDPDEVPELPEEPVTKLGDLWLLGDQRLHCGDSTKAQVVQRVMADERAALMPFDGPYGVSYDGGNHPQTWGKDGQAISGEDKTRRWDDYEEVGALRVFYDELLGVALEVALTDSPIIYQWFAMTKVEEILGAWRDCGLLPHQVIIWHKTRSVLGRSDFMYDYEPCLYGWRRGKRPEPARRPPANATTVWEVSSAIEDGAAGIHPTQKAVELIRRPILWHTAPGDLIFEPCAGSGTAIIAAEMTGRRCYAIELSPAFCDVAVERWRRFTGHEPVLSCEPKGGEHGQS